ncbi:response regulator transcription factor, partial [Chloroflexota bacterium]
VKIAGCQLTLAAIPDQNPYNLTHREYQIAQLTGFTNPQIGAALHITPATVKSQLHSIHQKLNTNDRHQIPTILAQLPQTITRKPTTGVYGKTPPHSEAEPGFAHNTPKSGNPLSFSITLSGHIPLLKTLLAALFN